MSLLEPLKDFIKMAKKPTEAKEATSSVRRKVKRKVESFSTYINKVLKTIYSDLTISKKAMNILNSFINDTFDRIATEAAKLVKSNKRRTLSSRDIHWAVRLLLTGEL